jgi:hypothetical protein
VFRTAPHFVKQTLFSKGLGWSEARFGLESSIPPMPRVSLAIASAFRSDAFVEAAKPSFKFVHDFFPNTPFRLDARCEVLGDVATQGADGRDPYLATSSVRLSESTAR